MFKTEEGINRARALNEYVDKKKLPPSYGNLLGGKLEMKQACEPTDVIWENRHFTRSTRNAKRVLVWSIILVCLAISAVIIFAC